MFNRIARVITRTASAAVTTGRETVAEAVRQARAAVEAARTDREVIVAGPAVEEPPTAEQVAAAAEAHEVARELYNEGSRGKRAARKVLDRTPTGEYGDWSVSWVQSSRREWDRDAIAAVFAELGREIPTRPASPTLRLTRAEQAVEAVEELLAA